MKKQIIGAIVAGLVLFIWQFLSWTVLEMHRNMQEYTPKQDEILKHLGENLEEGFYYLPTTPYGTPTEENQKFYEESMGKPWAQIYYHKALNSNIPVNMARGLIVDIIAMYLLIWVILKMGNPSFTTILSCSVIVGLIGYITGIYVNSIWFQTKVISDLIDSLASFGLVGLWLGWWLRR